jgi:ankyrin repeat protein
LHYAAWGGHLDAVQLLLTGRIETTRLIINVKATNGDTALHNAARNGHAKVVTMILQYGGDCTIRNAEQMMAVDLAAQFGRAVVVDALLSFRPGTLTRSNSLARTNTHDYECAHIVLDGFYLFCIMIRLLCVY